MNKITLRENSIAAKMLLYVGAAESLLHVFFLPPRQWRMLEWCPDYGVYKSTVYRMARRGLLEIVTEKEHRVLKLTKQGQLQMLLIKARLPQKTKWDNKWRMIIFDIPEDAKSEREQLRRLLLANNFVKLQNSVYVSPYALNREAVKYLKDEGLNEFIRIIRADEFDDDKDLKKKFNL